MRNRDTILLEEAYNKTRLLKEGGDQPMSVEDFEKEERLKGHVQRAEQRAEDEIAPKLGPVSYKEMNDGAFLDSITRKLAEIGNVIADQFPEEAKYLISLDSELNSLKDKLGRD